MASLYEDLIAAGVVVCNNCSDLYFEWTPVSREILKSHKAEVCKSSLFTSQDPKDNKATWCDTPFAYDSFWQNVVNKSRSRGVESGS